MYFWNIKKLKISLSKGPLSQKNTFRYLTYYFFLFTISVYVTYGTPDILYPAYLSKEVNSIIFLISNLCEIFYCYKFNGGKDGEDFLGRYVSIKLLTSIRLFVFAYVIAFLIAIPLLWEYTNTEDILGSFYRDNPSAETASFYFCYLFARLLIPLRVILHFRHLKKLAK